MKTFQRLTAVGASLALLSAAVVVPAQASPAGDNVVISEAYTNGGSANAVYTHKFVELYNPTNSPVSLDGWSLQYRSSGGSSAPTGVVQLSGTIPAKGYYLIQGNSNGSTGRALPTPDTSTGVAFAGTSGTLVLSDQSTALTGLSTGSVTSGQDDRVVDLLGYGSSNTFETAAAQSPSANSDPKSMNRAPGGVDTDDNSADFSLSGTVTPTSSAMEPGEPVEPGEPAPEEPVAPGEVTPIAQIQGAGASTPLAGQVVTTRGVVTAVYSTGGYNGYYLQTAGTGGEADDATPGASDGIFVYSRDTADDVALGDHVQVTGTAGEYYALTQLTVADGGLQILDEDATVEATELDFPLTEAEKEAHEGMLIAPAGDWTITDNYDVNAYGSLGIVSGDSPLLNPTTVAEPGAAAQAVMAENAEKLIVLDDGASTNFMRSPGNQNALPYLDQDDPVRVGSGVDFTTGVILDFRYDAWSFQPLGHLTDENADQVQPAQFENTRVDEQAPAEVGGTVSVATFNVLNYFTTLGNEFDSCDAYEDREGNPIATNRCEPRGAYDEASLERQQAKIVEAVNGLDASVVGLEEIENSAKFGKDRDHSLATLVEALNADAGYDKWAYAATPSVTPDLASQDVIRNAFIYQPDAVEAVGESVILDDQVAFDNAREPLAQVFQAVDGDESTRFIAITNHFKSKGSGSGEGNTDTGDGQGASNADRVAQAEALVAFAEDLKASTGVEKVLLIGDFNAYEKEDPIKVLEDAGYVSQAPKTGDHTYAFGGAVGSLDGIFTNAAAEATVTGADVWDINADESVALEYSRYNYVNEMLYAADQWRSSDHDPVLVGLDLATAEAEEPEEPGDGAENPNQGPGNNSGYNDGGNAPGQNNGKAHQGRGAENPNQGPGNNSGKGTGATGRP
ncbi:MAG: ExeM/NucH family extracellular endonuclease [Micrococcus sp.]|nr:ExeM/NucH family extracellular endonuclease [Micrococcus sp.]